MVSENAVELFRVSKAAGEKLFNVAAPTKADCNLEKVMSHVH
jgi:hypothetical protein